MADIDDIHRHIVHTPYREFPKHLHKADGSFKVVNDEAEQAAALGDGWARTPSAAADAVVDKPKRGKAE